MSYVDCYTSFDKLVNKEYQGNYRSNTKEGPDAEWHRDGRLRFEGQFTRGRLNGVSSAWYESGQKAAVENRLNGQGKRLPGTESTPTGST